MMTNNTNVNATINAATLSKLTVSQLKDTAKVMGLKGYSSLKKDELIKLIAPEIKHVDFVQENSQKEAQTDITILSLDELYNSKEVTGREKQAELARRANIKFSEKDHSIWSIQYLYNLLKGAEARAVRRAEFRSAFRKDENGWFVATGKDGTKYAFNETKVLVKIGNAPAKMKKVSSLQEGFDTCWDVCRELFGARHKNKK